MQKKQIDRFFELLAKELEPVLTIILTGAAAGALLGNLRPSLDIDFAIKNKGRKTIDWDEVDAAIERVSQKTGIQADYAEDIDRWGMISLLDYEKHAQFYKQFRSLRVLIMDPAYWSIGKMSRYLDSDIKDMVRVFKKQKISRARLEKIWKKALEKSPRSTAQYTFKKHYEHFLETYAKRFGR